MSAQEIVAYEQMRAAEVEQTIAINEEIGYECSYFWFYYAASGS